MNNSNALETVAILSSFLSRENRDYKDLVSPFVIKLLPDNKNTVIDLEHIQKGLSNEFGLEVPQKAITNILSRIKKNNRENIHKEGRQYILDIPFSNDNFTNKRLEMKELIEKVVNALLGYYKSCEYPGNHSFESARSSLIQFYKSYGYMINNSDIDELNGITIRKDKDNYPIARFIIEEKRKQSVTYSNIIQITKGFFAYKAIYFFGRGNKENIETKFRGVSFYFDTPLLIDMLGYDREDEKKAANELRRLLIRNGGDLKAFETNKDELAGILTLYAKDARSRRKLDLAFFRQNNYDYNDAIRLRNALEINLRKLYIKVEELPSYGVVTDENYKILGCIGLEEFTNDLKHTYKKQKNNHKPDDSNIEIDVKSVDAISRLRKGRKFNKIEKCKAIFVTDNFVILNCARKLVKGYGVPLCMSSMDLAALLWLSEYNEDTSLPESLLIESAYAACLPTNELMVTFHEKVNTLEKEGEISNDEALLLRTQEAAAEELVEITQNDVAQIKDDTVNLVLNRFSERLKAEEKEKKEQVVKKLDKINEIKKKKYADAKVIAEDKKENRRKTLSCLVYGFLALLLLSFVGTALIDLLSERIIKWYSYIGTLLTILGFADMMFSKVGYFKKLITRNSEKRYSNIYAEEVEKVDNYYSM